jgi:hypothetical protein
MGVRLRVPARVSMRRPVYSCALAGHAFFDHFTGMP